MMIIMNSLCEGSSCVLSLVSQGQLVNEKRYWGTMTCPAAAGMMHRHWWPRMGVRTLTASRRMGPSASWYVIHKPHGFLMVHSFRVVLQTADTHGFGWLDFDMPEEKKLELFKKGADAGHKLLNT